MEFFDVVTTRRSVRKFTSEPVPEAVVRKALDAAILAPNSSNMQMWEFYWVRSPEKKAAAVKACFSQPAAATAAELVFIVSRVDTWRRNRDLMIAELKKSPDVKQSALDYYQKAMPAVYFQDSVGVTGIVKKVAISAAGLTRPVPRGPTSRAALFEMVTKSAALAAQNFMLAVVAQGYACCPMEGYDEARIKKILGLGRNAHVVMGVAFGKADPKGYYGPQIRFDKNLFVFEV